MRITLEVFGWIALVNGVGSLLNRMMNGQDWGFLMRPLAEYQPGAAVVCAIAGVALLAISFSMKSAEKQRARS
ncbi:hypothetical protein [Crossiella cryophila]|uniref:Uncharacterized protein n=1 Tax=Crossiella cryophila TaxID=43355 RepID=A0A7W7CC26_9PSEU|nr:hypothetical protein [Crossiella cryophila]MBB4677118.1 hypothetical protein [Crossiella cryophila]